MIDICGHGAAVPDKENNTSKTAALSFLRKSGARLHEDFKSPLYEIHTRHMNTHEHTQTHMHTGSRRILTDSLRNPLKTHKDTRRHTKTHTHTHIHWPLATAAKTHVVVNAPPPPPPPLTQPVPLPEACKCCRCTSICSNRFRRPRSSSSIAPPKPAAPIYSAPAIKFHTHQVRIDKDDHKDDHDRGGKRCGGVWGLTPRDSTVRRNEVLLLQYRGTRRFLCAALVRLSHDPGRTHGVWVTQNRSTTVGNTPSSNGRAFSAERGETSRSIASSHSMS